MGWYSPDFGEVREDFESVEIDGFVVRSTTIDLGGLFLNVGAIRRKLINVFELLLPTMQKFDLEIMAKGWRERKEGSLRIFGNYNNNNKEGKMKVVINVERSQLRGVLQELGGSFSDMEVMINIKEEEFKEKRPNYESLTTEDLERIQEKQKETEKKEEYST